MRKMIFYQGSNVWLCEWCCRQFYFVQIEMAADSNRPTYCPLCGFPRDRAWYMGEHREGRLEVYKRGNDDNQESKKDAGRRDSGPHE